jgi:hypothetical protein
VCGLTRVAKSLIKELEIMFPSHGVMDILGIIYLQYWLQPDCDAFFAKHLGVLKIIFCYGKTHKVNELEVKVHELLNTSDIDCQQGMFKLTMKSNATSCMVPLFDINFLTCTWRLVTRFQILIFSSP